MNDLISKIDSFDPALKKAVAVWVLFAIVVGMCLSIFPHGLTSAWILLEQFCLLAIGILGWLLFRREQTTAARALFFSFFLFGVVGQAGEISVLFLGKKLLSVSRYMEAYLYQYTTIGTLFFCCLSVINSAIAGVRKWKEVNAILTTGFTLLFISVFGGYFVSPQRVYLTPDITDFRIIDRAVNTLEGKVKREVKIDEVVRVISLSKWDGKRRIGELSSDERRKQVERILPYVEGSNYTLLLFRPLFKEIVLMMGFSIIVLLISLGIRFLRDPPVSAYLERIPLVLLFYGVFRYVHYSWYAESTDLETCLREFNIGSVFSVITLIALGILLLSRLRFIGSAEGRYYEKNLWKNAEKLTRWRDGADNFVMKHFFYRGSVMTRRFLTVRGRSPKTKEDGDHEKIRSSSEKRLDK